MSDSVGKPILDPSLFGIDPNANFRDMFVDQMRDFAETIENSPSGPLVTMMLVPYLSMFGADSLVERLDSEALIDILHEAADTAESSEDTVGVIFGYHSGNQFTMIAFNFTEGTVAKREATLGAPGDTVGEQLFFETAIRKELASAADELNMAPLTNSTLTLCGVSS